MGADRTLILVLNYNGRRLLAECLPSIVEAAARSPRPCAVGVVDNDSTDDSIDYLRDAWPKLRIFREPNRGLASFNSVLRRLDEPVVLLLNNDVKLDPDAVEPLVRVFDDRADALFSAPLCWDFDGEVYEGMRTRVRSRFGLVRGACRVPDHERTLGLADLTAAAGPILAVDRRKFLKLGGYDPLYFPGRIEDLDLGFRAWMAGLRGYYVPESIAFHRGFASFEPEFGSSGCDRLALRNTLLFSWKNLAGLRLVSHCFWLPIRLARALVLGRFGSVSAVLSAFARLRSVLARRRRQGVGLGDWTGRQEAFFRRFEW